MTYHFVFDQYAVLWLETTFLVCRVGGWLGGWIKWKYNQLSPQLGWAGAGV